MGEHDAIARFWAWWPGAVARLEPASDVVSLAEIGDLVRLVEDIHPKIQVLGKYTPDGSSWLCLSSRGNLEVRTHVERWASLATPSSDWRFLTARPRSWPPKRSAPFPLEDFVADVKVDDLCEVIHVTLHHPALAGLDPGVQDALAFTALDHLLGEDDVERWIGNLGVSPSRTDDAASIASLRPMVQTLSERATGEQWQAVRAGGKENPLLLTINRALKPIDHVALSSHTRIDLMLQSPTKHGLAKGKEELELDDIQQELTQALGTGSVTIARETHHGHRIIHLHVDASTGPMITTWRQKYPQWSIAVLTQPDPQWAILHRWGGPGDVVRPSAFPPGRTSPGRTSP